MQHTRHRLIAAASLATLTTLAGCGQRSDDSVSGETGTQAARSARREASESVASGTVAPRATLADAAAGGANRSASGNSGANVMGAARDARGPVSGTDPLAPGTADRGKVDDNKIASMVLRGLRADKELNALRIDVDANDGVVTLSGAVPTAAARARAGEIARNVKEVRSVNDQLTVNAS